MKYPIRCMRTPSKEERMNVEWVLFDGGTNTLSSELRNNKEQQQQQINICKSFERWRQRQRQRNHCWSRVSRETKTKMNDDEVFLATEVTDLFERRGLCACQVLRRWLKKCLLGEIRKIQFFNARLNDTKKQKLERRPMSLNFWDVLVWRRPTFATFRASARARIHYDYFPLNHDI